jgi:hypothetical protein
MPTPLEFSRSVATLMQSKFAVLGRSLECLEMAELLNDLEAISAFAPGITVPKRSSATATLHAIPLLMTGQFRFYRLRLLRGYLRSIQEDVREQLAVKADRMALSGHWSSYLILRWFMWRAEAMVALLAARGLLFALRVPVRFDRACDSMSRFLQVVKEA